MISTRVKRLMPNHVYTALSVVCWMPLIAAILVAQPTESTPVDSARAWSDRFDISISSAHYFQPLAVSNRFSEPEYLLPRRREDRRVGSTWGLTYNTDRITDNPLPHAAGYVDINATVQPISGLKLRAGAVGEYRGMSYGIEDTRNTAVYPRINVSIDTSFNLVGQKFRLALSVGDYIDRRIDEGLTIYNMDYQGGIINLGWRSLNIGYEKVADGFSGIGLNVQDADHYSIALSGLQVYRGWIGSLRAGLFSYSQVFGSPYPEFTPRGELLDSAALIDGGYTLSGNLLDSSSGLRIYTQAALRASENEGEHTMSRTAFVAGISSSGNRGDFSWSGRGEYRFYGGLFNAGYRNVEIYYRDPERSTYANTVGPHLYSLTWLERPFSQWAVFTEYQNLKDITGWSLLLNAKYFFYDRFVLRAMLDLNYIIPEKVAGFVYPFYDVGIGWEPIDAISFGASLTNRGMNLDKWYPTYYLYRRPQVSFAVRWNVP